jgi:hypothetical protein
VRTALEWTKWMEGLLLSAAVCRGIVCIKISPDAVLPIGSYENSNGNCASYVIQLYVKYDGE